MIRGTMPKRGHGVSGYNSCEQVLNRCNDVGCENYFESKEKITNLKVLFL